ncbi:hypothetical protein ACQP1O_42990 (plasmid) [Nocardia sp. CA-151230]|uniref:hypothetical protein n=1 Tax=Nocardia sp. CA-151230 TaxID=3239982 RepID=UPI003D8F8E2E
MSLLYIITIQWTGPNGSNNVTSVSGTTTADGRTREQLYLWVLEQAITATGAPSARAAVVFFSLEPNKIAVEASA